MSESLQLTKREWSVSLFAIGVSLSNFFGVDIYLPSLPAIEKSLGIGQSGAQLTISIYMLGMALSVFFCGPLSDKVGRKKVMVPGLLLNLLGSIICFGATTGHVLLLGRLIQGLGAGACMGGIRAMITDVFSAKKLSMVAAYLSTVLALSPIVAPVVGGYLQTYVSWRANFVVLGVVYLLLVLVSFWVRETNEHQHLHSFDVRHHAKNYRYLLGRPDFMTFAFCGGFAMVVSIAYATSAPFVFQKTLGLTPIQFGWMGIFIGVGNIAGKLLSPSIAKRCDMEKTMVAALFCILLAGVFLDVMICVNKAGLLITTLAVMLSFLGQGMTTPNSMALGLSPYRAMGGTANALLSFIQMLLSFIVSYVLSSAMLADHQSTALAGSYIMVGVLTLLVYFIFATCRCQKAA